MGRDGLCWPSCMALGSCPGVGMWDWIIFFVFGPLIRFVCVPSRQILFSFVSLFPSFLGISVTVRIMECHSELL